VGFRKIFVLFCTLVLLPAMLLSSFGVIAIQNANSAEKQRQREAAEALQKRAETAFIAALEAADRAVLAAATKLTDAEQLRRLRDDGLPIGPVWLAGPDGETLIAEAPFSTSTPSMVNLLERIRAAAADLAPAAQGHLTVADVARQGAVAVARLPDGRLIAYFIDADRMEAFIKARLPAEEAGGIALRLDNDDSVAPFSGTVERWMKEAVSSDNTAGTQGTVIAARHLRAPFERFSLEVRGPPPGRTTVVVYIVLMAVFYVALITGVVITSRLIWEETRLSRLKTDFVSHVSHELRTPLTSIRMFIETLRLGRAESREEQEECLELLSKETERLSDMIERVLGYARLKSGRRIFDIKPTDVDALLDDALSAFRAQTLGSDSKKLELIREVEAGLPSVAADRDALIEALVNLLGNAFKYTGPDKRIRLFARRHRKRVVIGVEDNGPGLPKSELRRVFDRFYQGGALLSRTVQGSGLGLAITRAIVEGQRGRVWAESELGHGSTFFIELPIAYTDS